MVQPVCPADADAWLELRHALWPEGSADEHRQEIAQFFAGEFPRGPWAVFLARKDHSAIGLAEVSIRPYAEGCTSSRVAYLEGWYVTAAHRKSGVGRALIDAVIAWGRSQGCTEMASDAAPDNETSLAAHLAVGFDNAGLVRCFRRDL